MKRSQLMELIETVLNEEKHPQEVALLKALNGINPNYPYLAKALASFVVGEDEDTGIGVESTKKFLELLRAETLKLQREQGLIS